MTETDHFEAGLATLSSDPKPDFPENAPWSVNGVAIPVNTVVNGGQNVDHFYPEGTLEGAGELLEGKPIVVDFHDLEGQADASNVIGEVTSAGYQKGVGLVFEGEVVDADTAGKIKHGYLDVSPTPARSLGEFDESMGAQRVERLADFRDLAVVVNGQPGAKVEMGTNPAVEALSMDALSRGWDTLADISDLSEGDLVSWNSSGDRNAYGEIQEVRTEGEDDFDSEIDGDVTVSAPAVLIEVHTPGDDEWEATGQMVAHKPNTVSKIDDLPDPDTLQSDLDLVPPEQAAENARRGLECVEEVDTDAGEAQGRDTARAIIDAVENDEPLSEGMVGEIASFDRHREQGNHTIDEEFEGTPCQDNGYVSWQLWGGDAGVDWAQRKNEQMDTNAKDTLQDDFKSVAGVRFQGTRDGKLDESEIDSEETDLSDHALYGEGEDKEAFSYWVVDADGFLRKGNVEAAHSLGCRGQCPSDETHDENLMELAGEFDTPPEFAQDDDSMEAVPVVTEVPVKENPREVTVITQ